jgi:hypothetical protein
MNCPFAIDIDHGPYKFSTGNVNEKYRKDVPSVIPD